MEKDKLTAAYNDQNRGAKSDYDRYFAGMDVTMKQKLAFIGAHFLLSPGAVVADMGCGSGLGSFQLAQLNPHINVVGIDINPDAVKFARDKYKLPNLRFEVGDVEKPDPALGPFDAVLNSSVLHHVYSFNGYDNGHVVNALKNQFDNMNEGGQLVIRDFVAWPDDVYCVLDLSAKGKGDSIADMSDADLLVHFSQTAKPLTPEKGSGFFLEELDCPDAPEMRRFRLSAKWVNEFALRKDYRKDWDTECLEDYGFWTQEEYRRELSALGGRVVYTAPFWNSWIVENRFRGKLHIYGEDGKPIDFPPTNFIAVVEKVKPGESLHVGERVVSRAPKTFLQCQSYEDAATGHVFDMAARPGDVQDYLPYKTGDDGKLYIYAKHGYPRPLANIVPRGTPSLDSKSWSGHMIEPIALTSMVAPEDRKAALAQRLGMPESFLGAEDKGLSYYPTPGMCDEFVQSVIVEVSDPQPFYVAKIDPDVSGLSTAGDVRSYRAQDILRAAQVGMLPEARLELNTYRLMMKEGETPDVWIGSEMLPQASAVIHEIKSERLHDMLAEPPVQAFTKTDKSAGYLRHVRSGFADTSENRENARQEYEFIIPGRSGTGTNVVSILPIAKGADGEWYVGLECRDLPAPQNREGSSRIPVVPAYRLPNSVASLQGAADFVADKIGAPRDKVRQLGEGYFSSIGISPERVFPFVAEVDPSQLKEPLRFVPLSDVFANMDHLRDAHLMIAGMRGIHAMGLWAEYARKLAPSPMVTPTLPPPACG